MQNALIYKDVQNGKKLFFIFIYKDFKIILLSGLNVVPFSTREKNEKQINYFCIFFLQK